MSTITRDISAARSQTHDLIIIGGGIYGAMLMLEACKAGLKPLMIDRSDFGGQTSFNNLRIVHGGLRYLQSAHLSRFHESVRERQWFLKTFPELVFPISCLMPLYGQLMKNKLTLKAALSINDVLSRKRNRGVAQSHHLANGQILSVSETIKQFPGVRTAGLKGAALWYDAVMPDCHRILMETIRWSVAAQGSALNYVSANELITSGNKTVGIIATDEIGKEQFELRSDVVINATGPACLETASRLDRLVQDLYVPSLAWNLLLDREPLSTGAVAVQAPGTDSQVYFAHSLNGRLLFGTGHQPVSDRCDASISPASLDRMLSDINRAIPGMALTTADILHVFQGQLPVKKSNSTQLCDEARIVDHSSEGGPSGLYSLSGVKFTTARSTAQSLISTIRQTHSFAKRENHLFPDRPEPSPYALHSETMTIDERKRRIQNLLNTECPQYLGDLFYRRSNLAMSPSMAQTLADESDLPLHWE